ncbi:hypothetical protein [Dyadobacter sp. CY312]|uniref:hypothetical protein n=1 Tax=Dyadobacter sp. CY312 TaxID=2907303 RepID=UPI001F3835C9|nr:hypothetical protein [Dyadobacter sp. CY312]MCE7040531.1 hypothetical protein [Dyadobacter sp. CY312]
MKKPYNEIWIENLQVQRICEGWLSKKLITPQQNDLAKIAFPQDFYLPGIFVRIGLFIFAMMGCSFFTGFISLFFIKSNSNTFIPVSLLSAIVFSFT